MNKVIFFDVDNTLVCRENHHICETTLEALALCKENQVKVALATGRSLPQIKHEGLDQFTDMIIASNGSYIQYEGRAVHKQPIKQEDIIHLIKYFRLYEIPYVLHLEEESIGQIEQPWIQLLEERYNMHFKPMRTFGNEKVYQINVRLTPEQYELIHKKFEHIQLVPLIDIESGYDLFNKACNKGEGVKRIKEDLLNKTYKYYCFGDGYNDLEMFEQVDYAIAMGNGCKDLKERANYVTDTVNNQGIYKALKHINMI